MDTSASRREWYEEESRFPDTPRLHDVIWHHSSAVGKSLRLSQHSSQRIVEAMQKAYPVAGDYGSKHIHLEVLGMHSTEVTKALLGFAQSFAPQEDKLNAKELALRLRKEGHSMSEKNANQFKRARRS